MEIEVVGSHSDTYTVSGQFPVHIFSQAPSLVAFMSVTRAQQLTLESVHGLLSLEEQEEEALPLNLCAPALLKRFPGWACSPSAGDGCKRNASPLCAAACESREPAPPGWVPSKENSYFVVDLYLPIVIIIFC